MASRATEITSAVKISQVYTALTGEQPRPAGGQDQYRVPAIWRDGDGPNVKLDDTRGRWHDFRGNEGGGVLDLVERVRGGSRAEALRWLADYAGMPLDKTSPKLATEWRQAKENIERNLPDATLWKSAAIDMGEDELARLKEALHDPRLPQPQINEVSFVTNRVARWRKLEGAELVEEYQQYQKRNPDMVRAMVQAERDREQRLMEMITGDRSTSEMKYREIVDEYRMLRMNDGAAPERIADLRREFDGRVLTGLTIEQAAGDLEPAFRAGAEQRRLVDMQAQYAHDLKTVPDFVVNATTGRTHHDDIRQGITDAAVEEALIREEKRMEHQTSFPARGKDDYARLHAEDMARVPKPPERLTNGEIVAETRQLHQRYENLMGRFGEAPPAERAAIVEQVRPLVEREQELRAEFKGRDGRELAQDRVPAQDLDIGYGR